MLVRLLYVSRACVTNDSASIDEILAQSRSRNQENGITGILVQSGDLYLQVLEGGRQCVNELYRAIMRDPRHESVELLHYEEIHERRFGSWTMGQVNIANVNASTVLRYSETTTLNPYTVSGEVSLCLLEELLASAAVIGRT